MESKNHTTTWRWIGRTYTFYTPQRNKVKVGIVATFFTALLLTPGTNWMAYPVIKILNKFPHWMYK